MSNKTQQAFDAPRDVLKVSNENDLDQKFVSQTLASETNKADGTYEYYVDMNGFRKLGIQLELSDPNSITVTILGSIQDDGTARSSCTYQDITSLYGSASFSASELLLDNTEMLSMFKFIKIKVVCAGVETNDYTIFVKELF